MFQSLQDPTKQEYGILHFLLTLGSPVLPQCCGQTMGRIFTLPLLCPLYEDLEPSHVLLTIGMEASMWSSLSDVLVPNVKKCFNCLVVLGWNKVLTGYS